MFDLIEQTPVVFTTAMDFGDDATENEEMEIKGFRKASACSRGSASTSLSR
jgi:hypothetical protein